MVGRAKAVWFGGGVLSLALLSAAVVPSFLGCNEPVGTNYGNPNTLDRKNLSSADLDSGSDGGAEPLTCGGDAGLSIFDGGCPSFDRDIYPYMTPTGKWQCSNAGCHGGTTSPGIDTTDPAACLASLGQIKVTGKAYVPSGGGTGDPSSWTILCNLQGTCGSPMPLSPGTPLTPSELCMLEVWLKCGAPR